MESKKYKYEQPECLPSGKDCGCYHGEAECQFDFGDSTKLPKLGEFHLSVETLVNVSVLR